MPSKKKGLGPHPQPPFDLAHRPLPLRSFSQPWFRIHRLANDPLYFGSSGDNRFDAPGQEYGVLYLGKDAYCAFIETFGHATGTNFVTKQALQERGLARIEVDRPLRLVDLTGEGLARLGADGRLCTGDLPLAQQWSLAFHNHPEQPDGVYYRARHDLSRFSAALFERSKAVLHVIPLGSLDSARHKKRLSAILDRYQFGLLGS